MKKSISFLAILISSISAIGQTVSGKLVLEQGQVLGVTLKVNTTISQQAMGQAIDFKVDGGSDHSYKVTNTTGDNSTLHHEVQHIGFTFDGMGQKRAFDSNNEKDMNGQMGKPLKDLIGKKFDMIIDPNGKVLMVQPEKMDGAKMDERLAIITSMLKDVLDVVQPPKKGSPSFFKILPENESAKGTSWADTVIDETITSITIYTITEINDSTVIINVAGSSITTTKAEMMGSETTTRMNNKTTGKIIVDRATRILREKNLTTESNGTTESSTFGSLPVTSKTTITISVKPAQ